MIVVTDSGILGGIANPQPRSAKVKAMQLWVARMLAAGHVFAIPAIAVYEKRRELVRSGLTASVAALDAMATTATCPSPMPQRKSCASARSFTF